MIILNELIKNILDEAVYAPSGDNSQPWYFEYKKGELLVKNLPEKDLPFYNFNQCGSHVAHGALLENINILAHKNGLTCKIDLFPGNDHVNTIAKITFESHALQSIEDLSEYIKKRVTNRKKYEKRPLPSDIKEYLTTDPEVVSQIQFIEDERKIDVISDASVVNEMTVLKTRQIHRFFFDHVVWTYGEEQVKREGLFVKTLEMPKAQELAFWLASHWPIMSFLNHLGVTKKIAKDNAGIFRSSAAYIGFFSDGDDPSDYIKVGRSLQRVWLKVTKAGYQAHPVTGVLFLNQSVKNGKAGILSKSQADSITRSYEEIRSQFGEAKKNLLFLLRVGKSDPPSAGSSRKPPDLRML